MRPPLQRVVARWWSAAEDGETGSRGERVDGEENGGDGTAAEGDEVEVVAGVEDYRKVDEEREGERKRCVGVL